MDSLALDEVHDRIASAAVQSGRVGSDVDLVVVSKQRAETDVLAAYEAGERLFGENRQQGLKTRIESDLPDDIVWHFIGPLQSRKARFVTRHAALLHSFDRYSLVDRWVSADGGPVLVQFNLASESQKTGFDPAMAMEVLDDLVESGIDVRGVMAIPPFANDPESTARWFATLREIFDHYREERTSIDICSMGMSNDYEVAIREGATIIRVGRAIFEGTNNGHDERQAGTT
ncbi:MAG: YggS family pyridoxal phosphate-dependent enzyme [Actinomycetia bacterium]|nr:YggS family pyridoxal phosphate-dependent enzyme [Actinomycetes bacterium]